jgi:hypothetical protein
VEDVAPEVKSSIKKNKTATQKPLEVSFDVAEDLKGFKTEQKKVISLSKEDQTMRNLFIT